jgi:putative copper resistance protein D
VWFVTATAGTGIAALILAMWLGGNLTQTQINGLAIGGTGNLTGWGLPATKLVLDLSSIGVIGMLLTSIILPEHNHKPTATARRCLRTASRLALIWSISSAALLIFSWSDVIARPITELPFSKLATDTAKTFPDAAGYITSTALALVIAAAITLTETRRGTLILLPLALYNLLPMALQGHASHGTILKYSIVIHIIAISLWAGGLAALLTHARKQPALLAIAVPRFSTIALTCYTAIAASGITAAWQLLGSLSAIWGSRYGTLITLKAAALIALGIFGWWHRRHTIPRIRTADANHSHRAFTQLAAAEIAIMITAVSIAVALSRTASPDSILLHSTRKAAASAQHTPPGAPSASAHSAP